MPLNFEGAEHNSIQVEDGAALGGLVRFTGRNGSLVIKNGCTSNHMFLTIGDNCSVEIDEACHLSNLEIFTISGSSVRVGKNCAFTWHTTLYCHEPLDITIGARCLISTDTHLSVSDMHSIFDMETGALLNQGASIFVGDDVWIASHVRIMKGVSISNGSVIGAASVVTKDIPANCVAAGTPAKVLKTGIRWSRDIPYAPARMAAMLDPAPTG